jgi:hypothetical protein
MQSWRQTRKATLFDVLNDDVGGRTIISLAQELHYSDIVSLSLASKEIHKAIYCSRTPGEQTERLYMAICKDSKSECWCCGIQICRVRVSFLSLCCYFANELDSSANTACSSRNLLQEHISITASPTVPHATTKFSAEDTSMVLQNQVDLTATGRGKHVRVEPLVPKEH